MAGYWFVVYRQRKELSRTIRTSHMFFNMCGIRECGFFPNIVALLLMPPIEAEVCILYCSIHWFFH